MHQKWQQRTAFSFRNIIVEGTKVSQSEID